MASVSRFGGPQRCVRVERCIARTENGKYLVKVGRRMAGGSVYVRRVLPTLAAARAYLAEIECARAQELARKDARRLEVE